jgi:hypothetical protein
MSFGPLLRSIAKCEAGRFDISQTRQVSSGRQNIPGRGPMVEANDSGVGAVVAVEHGLGSGDRRDRLRDHRLGMGRIMRRGLTLVR